MVRGARGHLRSKNELRHLPGILGMVCAHDANLKRLNGPPREAAWFPKGGAGKNKAPKRVALAHSELTPIWSGQARWPELGLLLLLIVCGGLLRREDFFLNMPTPTIMARFGASIQNLRYGLDLSQKELAERAGLHRAFIAGIEAGRRNITLKTVDKLARALQVSTADLFSAPASPVVAPGASHSERPTDRYVDILFVENNPVDVRLTLEAFQHARITNHIHVVHDGAAALDFLLCAGERTGSATKRLPQIILLDLSLPKMSWLEVLRQVKQDPSTQAIPVIVLTASPKNRDIHESRRLGAENYIVKPLDFQNFSIITPRLQLDWALLRPAIAARTAPIAAAQRH
jgi:two-component system, response regulator